MNPSLYRNAEKDFTQRRLFLERLIQDLNKTLEHAPEGLLRINETRGRLQYFRRDSSKDKIGKYIRKKDFSLIRQLAQKEYHSLVKRAAEAELASLQFILKTIPEKSAEDVFDSLSPSLQPLITPFYEPDDVFVKRWLAVDYQPEIAETRESSYYTNRNEKVRSKSEVIIANLLDKYHLPYRYEFPVTLPGLGTVHPDFTVLKPDTRTEFYWEHLGMMDDADYAYKSLLKIRYYHKNGYFEGQSLILTYESSDNPLDIHDVDQIIRQYLLPEKSTSE